MNIRSRNGHRDSYPDIQIDSEKAIDFYRCGKKASGRNRKLVKRVDKDGLTRYNKGSKRSFKTSGIPGRRNSFYTAFLLSITVGKDG